MSETTDVVATHPLRVLHLEDSPRDAEMVRHKLDADGLACNILVASDKKSFEGALAREPFDLIISDYNLPGYDGITALKHAQETHPEVPVILIYGTVGEEDAVKCLQIGATDYLLKQRLERLVPAVHRAIHEADRRRAQKRVEAALGESESRKAAILDSVLDCIVTMDARGILLEFNAAASRAFGYTKAEAIGRPLAELIIPPRFRDRHRDGLARYLATGEGPLIGQVIEIIAQRSDGSEIPVELAITVIGSGSASIFTGVLRDTTARKHADDTRARLAAIVDSSDDAIVSMTLDGTVLTWNAGAERLYGYTASEMYGQSPARLVPAEKRAELPPMMERAARGDAGAPVDTQRLRKDGSVVNISLVISPMTDAAGHVTSVSTIARDIRLQKRAETDLLDRTNALERQAAVLAEQAALLDLAQDAIIVRSMDNLIQFWNCGAEAMYGWTSQEALGRDKEELLKSEFSESNEQIDATLLRDGRWEGEAIHHKRDGTPVTVASRWTLQRGADGAPFRILTINNDITKRKQAEAVLAQSEMRNRRLAESGIIGIAVADFSGHVLQANEAYLRLIGYSRDDLLAGRASWADMTPPEYGVADQRAIEQLRTTGVAPAWEKELIRKDGNGVAVLIGVAMLDGGNSIVFAVDVTDRKRAQEALLVAKEAAEAASRVKSEFLNNISHELRTPMNGILGMTALVLDSALTSEQREYLGMAKDSAEALLAIIDNMLDFSSIDTGALRLHTSAMNVRESVDATIGSLAAAAAGKGLIVSGIVEPGVPETVVGDPVRLRQVLDILTGNAIKFTRMGTVVLTVRQSSETVDDTTIQFSVTDTGIGIPPEKRGTIFQPFTQADGSTTRSFGGVGLGLTIASHLVRMMGGQIWCDSEIGRGSTFYFTARFGRALVGQP